MQPDWAATDPDMGFFDSVYLVGGPVFYKIMLLVNIVAVGIANIINAQMASSRLLYSMGRDGVIPRVFGKVHPKFPDAWFAPSSWARSRCAWRFRCRTTWARWRAS